MHCKMNVAARWLIIGVAVVIVTTGWAHPAPDPNRGISDALKYLQELDRIYAHVAMPRFGKRTELKHTLQDYDGPFQSEDNDKEWLSLSNGR
uniref:Neuropeptide F1 transcript a n=1 Tax=Carabus violaceus TaxID=41075 RepID=A0A7U3RBK2_CARVO|nr:neuropeptide F1 transcript a [Carabus violaceus]